MKEIEFEIFDGKPVDEAIERTTHMCIAAHQDDIEIMAYEGIQECFHQKDKWFFGVVVSNGSGSSRIGEYATYTNEKMINIRNLEQKKAALIGEYGALALLNFPSSMVKDASKDVVTDQIYLLLQKAKPKIVYTHNLADKHDTHIGVAIKTIKALRRLNQKDQPKKVIGCEVWRDLDWLDDTLKVRMDASKRPNLAKSLIEVFDSQISGGKRYDLGTIGRRYAHATFSESHHNDRENAVIYGMDLTPLMKNPHLDIETYVTEYIDSFKQDVKNRIDKMVNKSMK